MCQKILKLSLNEIFGQKLHGLIMNVSQPKIPHASLNIFIVPRPLPLLMIFAFLTYQLIAFSFTPNGQLFSILP